MGKIADMVAEIAQPIIEKEELELVDLVYVKEGDNYFLKIFIDSEDGVGLQECEKISNIMDEKLDEMDPIKESYILEVSSPGIERPLNKLDDFDRFIGKLVLIKTYVPIQGKKKFTGYIRERKGENIYLKLKDNKDIFEISFSDIAKARLSVEF